MGFDIYYVLLIFLINIHGLFHWKKKGITITNPFQKVLIESVRKPRTIRVDKISKFSKFTGSKRQ